MGAKNKKTARFLDAMAESDERNKPTYLWGPDWKTTASNHRHEAMKLRRGCNRRPKGQR